MQFYEKKGGYNMKYQKHASNNFGPLTKLDKKAKIRIFSVLMVAQNRS